MPTHRRVSRRKKGKIMNGVTDHNEVGPDLKGKDPKPCQHARMLIDQYTAGHQKTGKLLCKECGAIVSDPRLGLPVAAR